MSKKSWTFKFGTNKA